VYYLSLPITEADSIHKNKESSKEIDYADMAISLSTAKHYISNGCHLSATTQSKSSYLKIIKFQDYKIT
jgi:hypothetical protein